MAEAPVAPAEPVAEAIVAAASCLSKPEPEPVPEPVVEAPAPTPEPAPEPVVAAAAPEPEIKADEPAKPKRRGWWSLGSK